MRYLFMFLVILAFAGQAKATWKPEYANSQYAKWYAGQYNAHGDWCCDKSDGHPYYGDYTITKDGVTLNLGGGKIRKLPSYMLLTGANPTGHAVWWYVIRDDGEHVDYCFAPGTLS